MKNHARNIIVFLSICMALQMTSFVIILPLFARRFSELGAGVAALGISEMAYALTSTLAAPFMGALADRWGRRPLVLLSLAAYASAFCGYLLAQTPAAIIVIRGLAGALTAGLVPAVNGLAADVAPADRQAQWMGFINGGAAFGWIAGPIAGGMLYDRWGYQTALMVSIGMAILTLLVAARTIPGRDRFERAENAVRPMRGSARGPRFPLQDLFPKSLPQLLVLLVISFAVLFAWAFIEPRLMFYAYNDLGWSSSMLGLVMSAYGVAMMIGELCLGGLSDRLGRKPIILVGLVLFSAQFIGLAFFRSYVSIAVSFVIGGLGNALYDPAVNASLLDIAPAAHRSQVMGIKSMFGSTGTILGPALVALLSAAIDARGIFLIAVAVVFLTTLVGLAYPGTECQARQEIPAGSDVEGSTSSV